MNIWKQKLGYLMGEQTEKLAQARLANLFKMKRVQEEIRDIIMLREPMYERHAQWRSIQTSKYAILQQLHQNHSDEVTALRDEFVNEMKRMSE